MPQFYLTIIINNYHLFYYMAFNEKSAFSTLKTYIQPFLYIYLFFYTTIIIPQNCWIFNIFQYCRNYFSLFFNSINAILTSVRFTITLKIFNMSKLIIKFRIIYNLITYKTIKFALNFLFNFTFLCYKISLKRQKMLGTIILNSMINLILYYI